MNLTFSAFRFFFRLLPVVIAGFTLITGQQYVDWVYDAKIVINTGSSGADINSDLQGYPLLVRLNASNFDFSRAGQGGEDIRFSQPNGSALAYEIERWDADQEKAEIWVLVEELFGNDNSQYITLHWGNAAAENEQDSENVFDRDNNFKGVWHLGEESNNNSDNYKDATGHNSHCTGHNMDGDEKEESVIGFGQYFDGDDDYLLGPSKGSLTITGNLTISAWIKRDDANDRDVFIDYSAGGEDEAVNHLYQTYFRSNGRIGMKWEYDSGSDIDEDSDQAVNTPPGSWVYITAVRKASAEDLFLYENGVQIPGIQPYTNNPTGGEDGVLYIGRESTGDPDDDLDGTLDELRVINTIRTPDWTKMNYETQRPDQNTVTVIREDYSTWTSSRQLILNTSGNGANITGSDIYDFPVLVRLHRNNFSFNEASANGEDIRFAGPGGRHLPYEIERWDDALEKAEVWVKVDTILRNNNSQVINMYWGNSEAVDRSNPAGVFDIANGYAGVWHLNETSTNDRLDATGNGNDATLVNMEGDEDVSGIIGKGNLFGSDDEGLNAGDIDLTGAMTLSAWVKTDADPDWSTIFRKAHTSNADPWYSYALLLNNSDPPAVATILATGGSDMGSGPSPSTISTGTWYYLTGTYDSETIKVYVNGSLESSSEQPSGNIDDNNQDLFIGRAEYNPGQDYEGTVDEPRVSNVERSADWIKLNYENQKSGSSFILQGQGPVLGVTSNNEIPVENVQQLPDGEGSVVINFRAKEELAADVMLSQIRYNTGTGWVVIDDNSPSVPSGWKSLSYSSAQDFSGDLHTFKISTIHIPELAGKFFPSVQFSLQAVTTTTGLHAITGSIALDNEFPVVTVGNQVTPDVQPEISGTSSEQLLQVKITVNGNEYDGEVVDASSFRVAEGTVAALVAGTYTVSVTATDMLGNERTRNFEDVLTVNPQAPGITVIPVISNNISPTLSGTVTNSAASVTVTVSGESHEATVAGGTWSIPAGTFILLSEGTFDVTATALAGGVQGIDGTGGELVIDLTAPEIEFQNMVTNLFNPIVTGSVDEPVDSVTLLVNNQNLKAVVVGLTWTLPGGSLQGINEGKHSLKISAYDLAGNMQTDSSYTLTIDRTNPQMSSIFPNGIKTTLLPEFRIEFDEAVLKGSGPITILETGGDTTVINTSQIDGQNTNTLVFSLNDSLMENRSYSIHINPDAVTDIAGNRYDGFTDDTSWSFETADANASFISQITSPNPGGIYPLGSVIQLDLKFSDTVSLTGGNLNILLETGLVDSTIIITPFDSLPDLDFSYTVGHGDFAPVLDVISLFLDSGASLTNLSNGEVVLNIGSEENLSSSVIIGIDGIPLEFQLTAPASAASVENTSISYTLNKNLSTGSIRWREVDGTGTLNPDSLQDITLPFTAAMLTAGVHTGKDLHARIISGRVYNITVSVTDSAGNNNMVTSENVKIGSSVSSIRIIPAITEYNLNESVQFKILEVNSNTILTGGVTWVLDGGGQIDSLGLFTASYLGGTRVIAIVEGLADTLILEIKQGSISLPGNSTVMVDVAQNLRVQTAIPLTANTVVNFSHVQESLTEAFERVGPGMDFESVMVDSLVISLKADPSLVDNTDGKTFAVYQLAGDTGSVWKWVPAEILGDWATFEVVRDSLGTYILGQLKNPSSITTLAPTMVVEGQDLPVAYLAASIIQNPLVNLQFMQGGGADSLRAVNYISGDTAWTIIPGTSVTTNGLIYQFEMLDGTHSVETEFQEVNVPNGSNIVFGGELFQDIYQSFSVPMNQSSVDVEDILMDEWGEEDRSIWRLYKYNGEFEEMTKQSDMITGESYWYKMVDQQPVITIEAGMGTSVPLISGTSITLKHGWNMFSNPYLFPLSVSQLESSNGGNSLIVYAFPFENQYSPWGADSLLYPWKGYIVWNGLAGSELRTELKVAAISENSSRKVMKRGAQERRIGVLLSDTRSSNGILSLVWNSPGALEGRDGRDLPKPVSPVTGLSLDLKVPWSEAGYLEDRRGPLGKGQSWRLQSRSAKKQAHMTLTFTGARVADQGLRVVLLDDRRGTVSDFTGKQTYAYNYQSVGRSAEDFEILVGTEEYIQNRLREFNSLVRTSRLGQNFPNPFQVSTTIEFQVASRSGEPLVKTRLDVYDLKGKKVRTLVNELKARGRYRAVWDGRGENHSRLAVGTYVFRLKVGEEVFQKKLVLLR